MTQPPEDNPNPLLKTARTVLLASIGALALGKDEIEAIVNRMVDKGELAEKDGRKLISDLFERRKKESPPNKDEAASTDALDQRVQTQLARMNVPSHDDIASLTVSVSQLAQRVEELGRKLNRSEVSREPEAGSR